MAIPARPVAGALLDAAWGDIVHDEVVAMEIQIGTITAIPTSNGINSKATTFPHPFAGVPVVLTNGTTPSGPCCCWAYGCTATGFTIQTNRTDGGVGGFVTADYMAYGPRA